MKSGGQHSKPLDFAGGEFYKDNRWLREKRVISTENMMFLSGGKGCLIVISAYLRDHGIDRILLPSYLCPTIVTTLERCGLTCEYYQVKADFSIDLEDLNRKLTHHKALYFINYFGFLHPEATRSYLTGLRQKGILVVEDNAQAGFSDHTNGDFVFNSLRKLSANDGGYLHTSLDVTPYLENLREPPSRRLPLIRQYRQELAKYLFEGKEMFDELNRLYAQAEDFYEVDMTIRGDKQEREEIERQDWPAIKQARRENYQYLLDRLGKIPHLTPIFPTLQADNMPLGLPVYISGVSRDWLNEQLGEAGIGLTIHWEDLLSDPRLNRNPVAVGMARKILTLVIDQYTSKAQLDYQYKILEDVLKKGSILA